MNIWYFLEYPHAPAFHGIAGYLSSICSDDCHTVVITTVATLVISHQR